MEEELLKAEKGFTDAIARNDLKAIERFVTDDWIIINADEGIIDRKRFLEVIKSGANSRHDAIRRHAGPCLWR